MLESLLMQDRPLLTDWAEKNLILPRDTSPNAPGLLSFERTPYLKEPVNCAFDPEVQDVIFIGGSQLGKTLGLISIAAGFIALEPSDGIWSMTSIDQVREFSRRRVMEFIRANPALARHIVPGDPAKFTPLSYELDNMKLKFIGAGSPAQMASTPAAWVIADEAAKYEWKEKNESPPLNLLRERTKAFPRRFHVFASTPTTTENELWQMFLSTDMRQYFVPCPYCNGFFVLEFSKENVRWDKGADGHTDIDLAEASTRYICPFCHREIYNEQKAAMLAAGYWAPSEKLRREYGDERMAPSRHARGYQLSTMYSPFVTWGQYTREFLECLNKLTVATALQNLRNSWAGLPYEFTKITIKSDKVAALCADYARGTLPAGVEPYYIAVGYDPGGDETHWVACAVGTAGEMWVIDWGTILQARTESHPVNMGTDAEPDWQTVVDKPGIAPHFMSLHWGDLRPGIGFVDAGYMAEDVYMECAMLPGVLTPTKGSPTRVGTWYTRPAGPRYGDLEVLTYVDHFAKVSLYQETISYKHAPALHLPRTEDVDKDLDRGLTGQKLISKNGKEEWARVADDHFGDCIKICRVGWWALQERFEDRPTIAASEVPESGSDPQAGR